MKQRAMPSGHVRESVLQAMYRQALALHAKGELDAAEALYRRILAQMPESFHALHMLGVLVGQRDDLAQSERYLRGLAAIAGWRVESMTEQVLREEDGQDVAGHLTVLRRL